MLRSLCSTAIVIARFVSNPLVVRPCRPRYRLNFAGEHSGRGSSHHSHCTSLTTLTALQGAGSLVTLRRSTETDECVRWAIAAG